MTKNEQKVKLFYKRFKDSKFYYRIMVLVILVNILIMPSHMNPIIMSAPELLVFASPYISFMMMLIVFALYKSKILYITTILLTALNLIIPYVALMMFTVTDEEIRKGSIILGSWIIFFIINICIGIYTYKFKNET